ncbi:hypothetical protein MASR2M66_04530 [Chloroflexota bacterium]
MPSSNDCGRVFQVTPPSLEISSAAIPEIGSLAAALTSRVEIHHPGSPSVPRYEGDITGAVESTEALIVRVEILPALSTEVTTIVCVPSDKVNGNDFAAPLSVIEIDFTPETASTADAVNVALRYQPVSPVTPDKFGVTVGALESTFTFQVLLVVFPATSETVITMVFVPSETLNGMDRTVPFTVRIVV